MNPVGSVGKNEKGKPGLPQGGEVSSRPNHGFKVEVRLLVTVEILGLKCRSIGG